MGRFVKDSNAIAISPLDFENGLLNVASNIRPNRLFTADENIVLYKVGNLTEAKMEEVVKSVVGIFDN